MLAAFRRFAGTWPAKVFFVLLIASFGLWGVADVVAQPAGRRRPQRVATVGGQRIDPAELQDASRRLLAQLMRANRPPPRPRRSSAAPWRAGAGRLVIQAAFTVEAQRLRRQRARRGAAPRHVRDPRVPGPDGAFNRAIFSSVLRMNNYTEARYLALLRTDLAQRAAGGAGARRRLSRLTS